MMNMGSGLQEVRQAILDEWDLGKDFSAGLCQHKQKSYIFQVFNNHFLKMTLRICLVILLLLTTALLSVLLAGGDEVENKLYPLPMKW